VLLSWLVILQNERGDELRRAPEPLDIIEQLLPVEDEAFPYLSYLDPYGNTIFSRTQMKPFLAKELNVVFGSDAALDEHIRNTAITLHHPLGTCKMGRETDEMAVVDPQLRVRGVEQLRVVDASVMPDLISGNINAPVIMIAEKAADMIRGAPTLAPLNV